MPAEIPSHVNVLASEQCDRQLMTDMVTTAGYRVGAVQRHAVDVQLSDRSGVDVHATVICHRRTRQTPIPEVPEIDPAERLVVFSDHQAEESVVQTLEAGAHHYFDLHESRSLMQARLGAALRCHSEPRERYLDAAPFRFDLQKRCVTIAGRMVDLSPKEFDFAYYLFSHRDRVVATSELMTTVWSLPSGMDTRRIDTAACRVRKKMSLSEQTGWYLRRLRRAGYELFCGDERQSGSGATPPTGLIARRAGESDSLSAQPCIDELSTITETDSLVESATVIDDIAQGRTNARMA